jgi:two-component system, chemotaxis family, chemotaxis protein CheY
VKKIMVIDDSDSMLQITKALLEKLGYEAMLFPDTSSALLFLKAGIDLPYLILADIIMPKMDGYSFCRAAKKMANIKLIPIIFVTSLGSDWDKKHAKECGASGFITKPVDAEKLQEAFKPFFPEPNE